MKKTNQILVHAVIALAMLACDETTEAGTTEPARTAEPSGAAGETTADPGPAPAALTDAARGQIRRMLTAYEQARDALAQDRGDVAEPARAVAQAADAARAGAPDAIRTHLTAVATQARELSRADAGDLSAVRRRFGEVSRHVVALLEADRSLAEGLHLYRCPMAQGYQKWVQPSESLENPYMGSRMSTCGSELSLGS